jgi:hypothetical protein
MVEDTSVTPTTTSKPAEGSMSLSLRDPWMVTTTKVVLPKRITLMEDELTLHSAIPASVAHVCNVWTFCGIPRLF